MNSLQKLLMLFLFAVSLAGCANPGTGNGIFPANGEWGPATSVPQVYMTPYGDRVGHYAPYFYPDGPSGRER